ncbi:triose-phosphate isomerase [Planctomycetota bacterium]
MRKPIIAANWKMNLTIEDALSMVDELAPLLADNAKVDIVICPNSLALPALKQKLQTSNIKIGAQNVHFEPSGAFTGETSIPMLQAIDCDWVIAGHSERRAVFGESDDLINRKVLALLAAGMGTMFCIGETLEQRNDNETLKVVQNQIKTGLKDVNAGDLDNLVIAYEPVWAIGTGQTATPEQAQEAHRSIRQELSNLFGKAHADELRIQYGGSVKKENIGDLMLQPDIDGALVGGASLEAKSFAAICNY